MPVNHPIHGRRSTTHWLSRDESSSTAAFAHGGYLRLSARTATLEPARISRLVGSGITLATRKPQLLPSPLAGLPVRDEAINGWARLCQPPPVTPRQDR